MPVEVQKINLATDLQSRDGTITYDGRIKNGYVEKVGDNFRVYKRTGLSQLFSLGAGSGHGITNYVDASGNENLLVLKGTTLTLPVNNTIASGTTWTAANPPVSGKVAVYFVTNNTLYAITENSGGTSTDLYSKATAATASWTLVQSNITGGTVRNGGTLLILRGVLYWLPDGQTEVWRAYDPTSWTRIATSPGWATDGAAGNIDLVYNNKLWHFAQNGTDINKIWNSSDGITWTAVVTTPAYNPGAGNYLQKFAVTPANGKMWVCAGNNSGTAALNKAVYYSTDGITWSTATSDWAIGGTDGRLQPLFYSLYSRILVMQGGDNGSGTPQEDLWTSPDGVTWTQIQTSTLGTAFFTLTGIPTNDVFFFDDGTIVVSAQSSTATSYRYGYCTPASTTNYTVSSSVAIVPGAFVDFATNYTRSQVMVRCDTAAYKFDTALNSLTAITDADYPAATVRGCVYLDGTFYVMDANGTIYGSAIDDCTSWDPLNFVSAEADPDQGVFLAKKDAYVVAMGSQTIQYFWDAANATGSPLSPVQSGVINIGCAHGFSVQQMESSVIFMGQRKAVGTSFQKGRFVAMLTDGLNYKTISTPDVDRILNADDLATVYSCVSAENGHNFYHLLLGTSALTLTYDLTTGLWHIWTRSTATGSKSISALTQSLGTATATSTAHGLADGDEIVVSGASPSGYNGTFNITYVDANTFTYPVSSSLTTPATGTITAVGSTESYFDMVASCSFNGTQVFQDQSGGIIWQMLDSNTQDNSVSINFTARTPKIDYGKIYWKMAYMLTYMGNVSATADVGLLRYTDDDYQTYKPYRQFDLTDVYSNLHRFGKYRRRAWEWRHTRAKKHYIDFLQEDVQQGSV